MKNFPSKGIRFSGDSIKSCVGFIDLVDSTKNTITMDNLEHIRKYYSKFINLTSEVVKSYGGKVIKNIGDCILFYFPKTTDFKDTEVIREIIECGFKILDERYIVNQELSKEHLPPFNYRMKNLNGFQLHQQIKAIDPTIKILFVTALDILNEFSTIIPGISKEQIMRKPVDKNEFTNTVKKLLK
jgi:hypothetical protein